MHGAHATVINSTLYITGGWCPKDPGNIFTVKQYRLDEDQWSVLPPLHQYLGIPVNINNHLTIISGKHSTPPYKATNLVTTFTSNTWTSKYPNLSVAREQPAVVPYHQYVIVAGGIGDDDTVLDSIEVFDIAKSHWMIVNTLLPKPMYGICATTCGDSLAIVGYDGADNIRYPDTFIICIDKITSEDEQMSLTSSTNKDITKWHRLIDAPYWRTALVPNTSSPVIIGGNDKQGNTVNDITIYDDISSSWKKISSLPINCATTTVAVINQCIIVLGGASDTKTIEIINATALNDVIVGKLVPCDD